jgi:hypothetical protein
LSAREIRERAMANPDPLSKPAKQMLADRLVGHRAPSGVAGAGAGAVSSPIDEVLNALDAAREKLGGALPRAFQARKRAGAEKKTPDGKLVPVLPAERMKQRADELAAARRRIAELEQQVRKEDAVQRAIRPQPAPQPNAGK